MRFLKGRAAPARLNPKARLIVVNRPYSKGSKPGAVPSLAAKLEEVPRRSDVFLIELGIFIMSAIMHSVTVLSRANLACAQFGKRLGIFTQSINARITAPATCNASVNQMNQGGMGLPRQVSIGEPPSCRWR
jgi:hypothetical protein